MIVGFVAAQRRRLDPVRAPTACGPKMPALLVIALVTGVAFKLWPDMFVTQLVDRGIAPTRP